MKESESEVLKIEESESELLCTDSTALVKTMTISFAVRIFTCLLMPFCGHTGSCFSPLLRLNHLFLCS
jgi:hypothetical protein